MSQLYVPGLEVSRSTTVEKTRELPLPGRSLVALGDEVSADSIVLSADLPGDLEVLRVADRMGMEPMDVVSGILVKEGDAVENGDLLCRTTTFFGLFTTEFRSPLNGTVEFLSKANAHIGIRLPSTPLEVDAYIDGEVVAVNDGKSVTIKSNASLIQGVFGVGGEARGTIKVLQKEPEAFVDHKFLYSLNFDPKGCVLVGGAGYTLQGLRAAADLEVAAVVTGSIDAATLGHFVGRDIGVSITGDEDVAFTLIITEGFGRLGMSSHVLELARELEGRTASLNGATQVRAGAMRPELIVPSAESTCAETKKGPFAKRELAIGARVRFLRQPLFGKFGVVTSLPEKPERIPSGARVRVLRAKLDSGEEVTVPRANVELS